jgi:hypothetical protein
MEENKETQTEEQSKNTMRTARGCPAPEMPAEFFEQYPGVRWDEGECIWRDSGGNPIGGG